MTAVAGGRVHRCGYGDDGLVPAVIAAHLQAPLGDGPPERAGHEDVGHVVLRAGHRGDEFDDPLRRYHGDRQSRARGQPHRVERLQGSSQRAGCFDS